MPVNGSYLDFLNPVEKQVETKGNKKGRQMTAFMGC